jgi:O-antigen ligase
LDGAYGNLLGPTDVRIYGPGLIGEPAPFPTAGFYSVLFFLALGLASVQSRRMRFFALGMAPIFILGIFASGSRAIFYSGMVTFFILALMMSMRRASYAAVLFGLAVLMAILIGVVSPGIPVATVERILDRDLGGLMHALSERHLEIWSPAFAFFVEYPFLGGGKSIGGSMPGLTGEAHNHYLRILTEMGILGLLAFLFILIRLLTMAYSLYRQAQHGSIIKAIAFSCLAALITLSGAALVQDAFIPVKVMMPFWVLVGMTAAAVRIQGKSVKTHYM